MAKDPDSPTPAPKRENAQGEHAGMPHDPEEFDSQNPAVQVPAPGNTPPGPQRKG